MYRVAGLPAKTYLFVHKMLYSALENKEPAFRSFPTTWERGGGCILSHAACTRCGFRCRINNMCYIVDVFYDR